jgi:hypothetical protein
MKECDKIRALLGKYLDGRLTRGKMGEVENHLIGCPECRRQFEQMKKLESMAEDFQFEGNAEYWEGSKEKILAGIPDGPPADIVDVRSKRRSESWVRFAAVAASIVLVAFISYYEGWYKKDSPVTSPSNAVEEERGTEKDEMKATAGGGVEPIVDGDKIQELAKLPTKENRGEGNKLEIKIEEPPSSLPRAKEIVPESYAEPKDAEMAEIYKPEAELAPEKEIIAVSPERKAMPAIPDTRITKGEEKPKKVAKTDLGTVLKVESQEMTYMAVQPDKAGADTADLAEYILWKSRAEYLSARYASFLSPHYPEAAAKQRTEPPADSLGTVLLEMGEVFFNVGKLSPDRTEQKEMLERLQILRGRADVKSAQKIQDFITSLEAAIK